MEHKNANPLSEDTDAALIKAYRAGARACLGELMNRYRWVAAYWVGRFAINEAERDDFIQEGMIALYSALPLYDPATASFSTFASVCIKHGIQSALRRASAKKQIPSDLVSSLDDLSLADPGSPESHIIAKEDCDTLLTRIRQTLSDKEYTVLSLYLRYGTYDDICRQLGCSHKEVNNALTRARQKIRAINGESRG